LGRKKTVLTQTGLWSFSQASTDINHEDLPCSTKTFYFHPGLNAIMYLMDDMKTIVIKQDKTLAVGADMCESNFLHPTNTKYQQSVDIVTLIGTKLGYSVTSIIDNWLFFNDELYLVANILPSAVSLSTKQTLLVRCKFALTATKMTTSLTAV
jgi:hypothetical protein